MLHKKIDQDLDFSDVWKDDVLNRQEIADEFIRIISTIKQPFVVSMSSRYGTGKTYFATRCVSELKKRNFAGVYFDAWQNDYVKEPLAGFVYTVANELKELCGPDDIAEAQELISKAAKFIAKRTVPLAAKGMVRFIVGESGVKEISDGIASLTEQFAIDAINGYENTIGEMEAFQIALSALSQKARKTNKKIKHDQVVVFVDELDRCRPDYTIEILESIKHLFSVENFIFVLMSDEEALEASVATVYSEKISADHYLRKFVDWRATLPDPSRTNYAHYLTSVFQLGDVEWMSDDGHYLTGLKSLADFFGLVSCAYELTLREMDQCFTSLNLVLRGLGDNRVVLPLLAVLSVMKEKDRQQYNQICFKAGRYSFDSKNVDDQDVVNQMQPILAAMVEFGTSQTQEEIHKAINQFSKLWHGEATEWQEKNAQNLSDAVRSLYESTFNMGFYGINTSLRCKKHTQVIGERLAALSKFA